jgi:hypothetical protein
MKRKTKMLGQLRDVQLAADGCNLEVDHRLSFDYWDLNSPDLSVLGRGQK